MIAVSEAQVTKHTVKGVTTTYEQMVKNLFKPMEGVGARMMHAAIGIAGESGELRAATSRKNIFEECGDLEFYIEAAWQELPSSLRSDIYQGKGRPYLIGTYLGGCVDQVHMHAAEMLDHAKKVWVYGGAKGNRDAQIAGHLDALEQVLSGMYEMLGTTRPDVQRLNMEKLLGTDETSGRYATGKYSDEQALARADKAGEAEKLMDAVTEPVRKFMVDTVRLDQQSGADTTK